MQDPVQSRMTLCMCARHKMLVGTMTNLVVSLTVFTVSFTVFPDKACYVFNLPTASIASI